jgi:hypothetical protein
MKLGRIICRQSFSMCMKEFRSSLTGNHIIGNVIGNVETQSEI